jgi:tRNA threonylcarbamoyladenosine biosynthesis protein TsaE
MTYIKQVATLEETEQFGQRLGELVQAQDVITLEGDLGAGKTTFTKSFAKGLGVERNVNSPTFTILKQYVGRLPFNHLDVYRHLLYMMTRGDFRNDSTKTFMTFDL